MLFAGDRPFSTYISIYICIYSYIHVPTGRIRNFKRAEAFITRNYHAYSLIFARARRRGGRNEGNYTHAIRKTKGLLHVHSTRQNTAYNCRRDPPFNFYETYGPARRQNRRSSYNLFLVYSTNGFRSGFAQSCFISHKRCCRFRQDFTSNHTVDYPLQRSTFSCSNYAEIIGQNIVCTFV